MKVAWENGWEKTVRWNEGAMRYHGVPYLQNLPTSCPCGKCFFFAVWCTLFRFRISKNYINMKTCHPTETYFYIFL